MYVCLIVFIGYNNTEAILQPLPTFMADNYNTF